MMIALLMGLELLLRCGFESRRAMDEFFKRVGALRNALAHANDLLSDRWPALVDVATRLEALLEQLEAWTPEP